MRQRLQVDGSQRARAAHGDPVVARLHVAAHGAELHERNAQIRRIDAVHGDGTARQRASGQEGAGLDAVAHRRVLARMQRRKRHALDLDDVRARACDARPHGHEHVRKIHDLGFARGVLYDRGALGRHGGHEQVLGCSHTGGSRVRRARRAARWACWPQGSRGRWRTPRRWPRDRQDACRSCERRSDSRPAWPRGRIRSGRRAGRAPRCSRASSTPARRGSRACRRRRCPPSAYGRRAPPAHPGSAARRT